MIVFIVVLAALALLAATAVGMYNGLIRRRNRTAEAWSQIDVELKRRHDLVPNLVETVSGYASHEKSTFDDVTRARAAAVAAGESGDPSRIAAAENALTGTLRSLFAVAENYPVLRASENFLALQEQLTATEDKLEYARRYYNTSARDYNIACQTFPRSAIASMFHFVQANFFESEASDREVPQVRFPSSQAPKPRTS